MTINVSFISNSPTYFDYTYISGMQRHNMDKLLAATAVNIHVSIAISCLPPVPTQGSAPVL